jgi:1,4-dihydroxy-2-naphthoyl-CoA hydrolase
MTVPTEAELLEQLNGYVEPGTFQNLLGVHFVAASLEQVRAELIVQNNQISRHDTMHGGALMALADCVGGFSTRINLGSEQYTTTLESKTNFLRAAAPGERLSATAVALHRGRKTMVWQTTIRNATGKTISITIQTQMVLSAHSKRPVEYVDPEVQTLHV